MFLLWLCQGHLAGICNFNRNTNNFEMYYCSSSASAQSATFQDLHKNLPANVKC
jgi:hypothetical protein